MTYELIKKLKDVGFAQKGKGCFYGETINAIILPDFYIPTLSELIEACGKNFFALQRLSNGEFVALHNPSGTGYKGEISEEAVANLWLELNKKL